MKTKEYIKPLLLPKNIINSFSNVSSTCNFLISKTTPKVFTLMLVPSEKCNLKCNYCYETDKNPNLMDISLAKEIIKKTFENLPKDFKLKIELRGGEPFLEFDWIKHLYEWITNNYEKRNYFFYIVTNGTCFTSEIKKWILENKDLFYIVISLDGNKKSHNLNRCNSFDLIDFNFLFQISEHPYTYTTIMPNNISRLFEDVIFLIKKGFYARINFEFKSNWKDNEIKIAVKNLKKIADFMLKNNIQNKFNLFSIYGILDYITKVKEENRRFELNCNAGKYRVIYSSSGKKYPCHAFVPSVFNNYSKSTDNNLFEEIKNKPINPQICCSCNYFYLCHICIGFSYNYANDFTWRNLSICKITKFRTFASAYYYGHKLYDKYIKNEKLSEIDKQIVSNIYKLHKEESIE